MSDAAAMRVAALRWIVIAAAGLVAALAVVSSLAPASLLDVGVREASGGRLRVADAEGTVWRGSARLVLADTTEQSAASSVVAGLALPGRLQWDVAVLPLLLGMVDARVSVEGMPLPVRLSGALSELRISSGAVDLPSAELSRLGSPWNTIQPSAAVSLRWEALTVRSGVFDGRASIELRDTASAMTPVRPLGTYRIDVNGSGREVALALTTVSGPLRLQGNGSWNGRAGLRFTAEASADGPERTRLLPLLALIGRREGEKTIIKIGA